MDDVYEIVTACSLVGSAIICLTYLLFPKLQKTPWKFVFWINLLLIVPDVCALVIWNQFPSCPNQPICCTIQAAYHQFFSVAGVSWYACLAIEVMVLLWSPLRNTEGLFKFYHLFVLLVASCSTLVLLVPGVVGQSGSSICWIRAPRYRWTFFGPLLLAFVLDLVSVPIAILTTRRVDDLSKENRQKILVRMCLYIAIFACCWSGSVALRGAEWACLDQKLNTTFCLAITGPLPPGDNWLENWAELGYDVQGLCFLVVWVGNKHFWLAAFDSPIVQRLKRFAFKSKESENLPLMRSVSGDLKGLASLVRRQIVTALLFGIRESLLTLPESPEPPPLQDRVHFQPEDYHTRRLTKFATAER